MLFWAFLRFRLYHAPILSNKLPKPLHDGPRDPRESSKANQQGPGDGPKPPRSLHNSPKEPLTQGPTPQTSTSPPHSPPHTTHPPRQPREHPKPFERHRGSPKSLPKGTPTRLTWTGHGLEWLPARRLWTALASVTRAPRRPTAVKGAPRRPASTPNASTGFPKYRPNHVPGRRPRNVIPGCRPALERYLLRSVRSIGRANHSSGTLSEHIIPHRPLVVQISPLPPCIGYFIHFCYVTQTAFRSLRNHSYHIPGPTPGNIVPRCFAPRPPSNERASEP